MAIQKIGIRICMVNNKRIIFGILGSEKTLARTVFPKLEHDDVILVEEKKRESGFTDFQEKLIDAIQTKSKKSIVVYDSVCLDDSNTEPPYNAPNNRSGKRGNKFDFKGHISRFHR